MREIPDAELRQLQIEYLSDLREKIAQIREYAEKLAAQSDFKTSFPALLFVSHQLRGSGGSLGFPQISSIAKRMADQLGLFLGDEEEQRPSPGELSDMVIALAAELESAASGAEESLRAPSV